MLINKDVFGITGGFLVRWKFNFFCCEMAESGLVGRFKRYGVRYGV